MSDRRARETAPVQDVHARRLKAGERASARSMFRTMSEVFGEDGVPLGDNYIDRLLDRPDFWAIAAFRGDEVVGGLTAHTLPMTRAESSEVFIYDLAVRADLQRRGIGRRLVEALRAEARAVGIEVTFVAADNADDYALDFYRALGGVAAPVTVFTFSGND